MPGPSLFCEHKRLVSVCPLCGAARAGSATPMRGATTHDVDDTIHALRRACHARAAEYLARIHRGEAADKAYAAVYPAPARGRDRSEEEDTDTFRGGFYRSLVKMFDITVEDRRIQGYNGLADWDEMRDYVFRKYSPADLETALRAGRLVIHGGNGAWPRQQIASELLRSDRIKDAAMLLAYGTDGMSAAEASEKEVLRRLEAVEAMEAKTLQLSSKVLHVLAPARWPALTPRATPAVGEELGIEIGEVRTPKEYLAFAETMRDLARARTHADLGRTDMLVWDTWESVTAQD